MASVWRDKGISNFDFFAEVVREEYQAELIDLASYPNVAFGVLEEPSGRRQALIISQWWDPSPYSRANYHYLTQLETEKRWYGDKFARCPIRILEKLSPESEFSSQEKGAVRDFRERSRSFNEVQSAKPRPKKGQLVVFDKPYIIDGLKIDTFEFLGKSTFRVYGDHSHQLWRLVSWRRRDFTVAEKKDEESALSDILDL